MMGLFQGKGDRAFSKARRSALVDQLRRPVGLLRYAALKLIRAAKPLRVPVLPATLDVEPNNYCNFACPHCQVTHWSKPKRNLDLAGFRRLLDQLPGLVRVKLQGMGEPLLNRSFLSLLEEGERRGISMRFVSNGSVFTPEIAERISKLERSVVTFSIDGATAQTFEQMRPGGFFERVVSNIAAFAAARRDADSPPIVVNTVVTRDNVEELAQVVELSAKLGASAISLQLFVTDWGKSEHRAHRDAIRMDRGENLLARSIDDARAAARKAGIELSVENPLPFTKERPCPWPWESAYIAADGDVVPWCMLADSDTIRMGNVFEQDFREIWNNDAYQDLRRRMRDHDLHDFCRGCYQESAESD